MTLPGEELILVKRKHWYTFVLPSVTAGILALFSISGLLVLSTILPGYIGILISSMLFTIVIAATFIGNFIIDWYLNLYIITSKKIIEVSYRPLSSRHINEILLDQVKCTEIDTSVDGIINELLDIGDVIITFDRPTHQEEFVLESMSDPKETEVNLENALCPMPVAQPNENVSISEVRTWFAKLKEKPGKWRFMEELRPVGN